MATQPKLCNTLLRFRSEKWLIHHPDSIHYHDICRVTIMIVLSLSTNPAINMLMHFCKSVSMVTVSNDLDNTTIAAAQKSDPVLDTVLQQMVSKDTIY